MNNTEALKQNLKYLTDVVENLNRVRRGYENEDIRRVDIGRIIDLLTECAMKLGALYGREHATDLLEEEGD